MTIRDRILDAAVVVLRERGQAGATTKEIARVAGCSEGSLYTHFKNKADLLLAVMTERLPPFIPTLFGLLGRAGEDTLRAHLEEVVRVAVAFYGELIPLESTVLASPELNEDLRRAGQGPHRGNEELATYLRLEQRLRRMHPDADPRAAADLLLGACQQRATQLRFVGEEPDSAAVDRFATALVATLLQGLHPGP